LLNIDRSKMSKSKELQKILFNFVDEKSK